MAQESGNASAPDGRQRAVAVCWFRREDYEPAKARMADPERLYENYDVWLKEAQAFEREMEQQGVKVIRTRFDGTSFFLFCATRAVPADGPARAEWAAQETMRRSAAPKQG
jgi:hypothetical protein